MKSSSETPAEYVNWCGHAQEFVLLPEAPGWCRLVPVLGADVTRAGGSDDVMPTPYYLLARAAGMAYAVVWDQATDEFRRVEGPRGFETYREAVEASRFLSCSS